MKSEPVPGPDPYETLGVSPTASSREIRDAFVTLIRKHRDQPGETQVAVIERARQINIAYDRLSDPRKRRAYDESQGMFFGQQAGEAAPTKLKKDGLADRDSQREAQGAANEARLRHGDPDGGSAAAAAAPIAGASSARLGRGYSEEDDVDHHDEGQRSHRGKWIFAAGALVSVAALGMLLPDLVDIQEQETVGATDAGRGEGAPGPPPPQPGTAQVAATTAGALPSEAVGPLDGLIETSASAPTPSASGTDAAPAARPAEATAQTRGADGDYYPPAATEPTPAPQVAEAAPVPEARPEPAVEAPREQPRAEVPVETARVAPPPRARRIGTSARWISGDLVDQDNSPGQLKGRVDVRFTVDANGRTTDCRPVGGTANAALGSITCQLIEQRLKFRPALDPDGAPISSELRTSYTWGRRQRR